jgi:hypothetical protein
VNRGIAAFFVLSATLLLAAATAGASAGDGRTGSLYTLTNSPRSESPDA